MSTPAVAIPSTPNHSQPVDSLKAITIQNFAKRFSVADQSCYRWAREGRLRVIRFGDKLLVPWDEVCRVAREGL